MEFHPDKCQILHIINKRKPILLSYHIHGTDLKPFDSAKYLGVTIDRKLGWDPHISYVYNKASFMMSFLERNLRKCPSNTKLKCINALVRPILDYGCCVWDPRKTTQIDRLEKSARERPDLSLVTTPSDMATPCKTWNFWVGHPSKRDALTSN